MGDFFGALGPLREAHEARPVDPLVRRDLARVLVRLGRGAEALDLVDGLPQVYRAPHTILLWAQAFEQAGRFGEAADRLGELLEALSTDDRASYGPAVRLRIARNRVRSGEFARALALTENSDDDPPSLRVHLQALDGLGRAATADERLRSRLAARPGDPAAIALLSLRAQRNDGSGLEAALAAIARAAAPALTAAEAAAWLTAWDDPKLGARILETSPLPRSPDPGILRAWASTLLAAGRSGEAERWFRQLLEQEPDDHVTMNDLGYLLASDGRSLDEAERLVRRALDLRPEEPAYLDSLGWALHRAGRSADALPLLKKAAGRARERDEAGIRQHLGDVYLALGDRDRARAEWKAAIALGSDQPELLRRKIGELLPEQATR
jgi:Flp pilus assembly protein TadD